MHLRSAHSPEAFARMNTAELRRAFLIETLFVPGTIDLTYWETDRTIIGSAVPAGTPLAVEVSAQEMAAEFFLQRRELGVINVGGPGGIETDGTLHALDQRDSLYVGRGVRKVVFHSVDEANPARFFLISYPAHAVHPVTLTRVNDARKVPLGTAEKANVRTIFQQIHEAGAHSCQLVMGFTEMASGSVWNTFPPHTHQRRSEVYMYFDLPADQAVVHLMVPGDETRNVVVRAGQAVLSPAWSIHSGCGTSAYRFIWAMGGENQRFDDIDPVPVGQLR